MFNKLVYFSLHNRLLVLVTSQVLLLYGGITVTRLQVDEFPNLNKPTITV